MTEPTVAEQYLAKLIAHWHGQKPLYRNADGVLVTVATFADHTPNGWNGDNLDRYVQRHWHEYVPAARAVLEVRS